MDKNTYAASALYDINGNPKMILFSGPRDCIHQMFTNLLNSGYISWKHDPTNKDEDICLLVDERRNKREAHLIPESYKPVFINHYNLAPATWLVYPELA